MRRRTQVDEVHRRVVQQRAVVRHRARDPEPLREGPRPLRTARALLDKLSFPPHRLVIEITESAVVQRLDDAKAALQSLRRLGVRIALDDFGTGYSGLYHLRELELDTIKIDRSFVGQMLDRPEEARIVKAMLSLSRALGLSTTAEGIENHKAVEMLKKLGCDAGQGYLFGNPVPASMVTAALNESGTAGKAGSPRQIA